MENHLAVNHHGGHEIFRHVACCLHTSYIYWSTPCAKNFNKRHPTKSIVAIESPVQRTLSLRNATRCWCRVGTPRFFNKHPAVLYDVQQGKAAPWFEDLDRGKHAANTFYTINRVINSVKRLGHNSTPTHQLPREHDCCSHTSTIHAFRASFTSTRATWTHSHNEAHHDTTACWVCAIRVLPDGYT